MSCTIILLYYVDCASELYGVLKLLIFVQAYPNWEWHSEASSGDLITSPKPNCSSLVSVFRVRADRCNRLWVLDSGVMDSLETFNTICPPKLLVFDMRTDRVVSILFYYRYYFTIMLIICKVFGVTMTQYRELYNYMSFLYSLGLII